MGRNVIKKEKGQKSCILQKEGKGRKGILSKWRKSEEWHIIGLAGGRKVCIAEEGRGYKKGILSRKERLCSVLCLVVL